MSLNFGRTQLAIPGPSVIPDRVLAAMHRPSPNIYAGELIDLTATLYPDLKAVARTKFDVAIYIANGHGAWECALKNTLKTGDKILVLGTGTFALGWGELAQTHGFDVDVINFGFQNDADPAQLEEALRADNNHKIKAVLTVQTDTASSVRNNIAALRQAINNCDSDVLFMVDCIASLGCEPFEMDEWSVDVMVSACQKGLMTPAGLAFVYFNDKAAQAHKSATPGQYWDWLPRIRPEVYYKQFDGTAPTHHLFALREALDMLVHEEGVEGAWARHETIANAIWAALEIWGDGGTMHHNIKDPSKRSLAVSAVNTTKDVAGQLRDWCEHEAGITLGIGLGRAQLGTAEWDQHFRIGHMGHQNIPMTMGVLGAMDTALKALNIPHGEGALDAATRILANHTGN